jgi:hypothetical protein
MAIGGNIASNKTKGTSGIESAVPFGTERGPLTFLPNLKKAGLFSYPPPGEWAVPRTFVPNPGWRTRLLS